MRGLRRKFAGGYVEIGAADAAGFDFEQDLASSRLWSGHIFYR
jgi:hypothetical protein